MRRGGDFAHLIDRAEQCFLIDLIVSLLTESHQCLPMLPQGDRRVEMVRYGTSTYAVPSGSSTQTLLMSRGSRLMTNFSSRSRRAIQGLSAFAK